MDYRSFTSHLQSRSQWILDTNVHCLKVRVDRTLSSLNNRAHESDILPIVTVYGTLVDLRFWVYGLLTEMEKRDNDTETITVKQTGLKRSVVLCLGDRQNSTTLVFRWLVTPGTKVRVFRLLTATQVILRPRVDRSVTPDLLFSTSFHHPFW